MLYSCNTDKLIYRKMQSLQLLSLAGSMLLYHRVPAAATSSTLFYIVTDEFGSSPVCRLVDQSVVTTVGKSMLDCSRQCLTQARCTGFNSLITFRTCELFFDGPAQGYTVKEGCTFYTISEVCHVVSTGITINITGVDARNCSFPFTYNGQLYYNCIHNVTNVTVCPDEYACMLPNRTWAICISSQEYQAQNITANIMIPTLPNQEVMMVNDWIIIQQRVDGNLSFQLPWLTYRNGFGSLGGNYWLGLEAVYQLTAMSGGQYKLRMEMCAFSGGWYSAEYSNFILEDEANYYRIHIWGYSGDNGDAMQVTDTGMWYYHNGMYFSTIDCNHDNYMLDNCASWHGGGWWYNSCQDCNFNGYYGVGGTFYWDAVSTNPVTDLSAARMMIKLVV